MYDQFNASLQTKSMKKKKKPFGQPNSQMQLKSVY